MSEHRSVTDAFKRDLLARSGGALTMTEVRMLIDAASVRAVMDEVAARRLLVVDEAGTLLFPAFQFEGGSVALGVCEVLAAAPTTGGWALLQFFVDGDEGLGAELPMILVKGGRAEIDRVVRFARKLDD